MASRSKRQKGCAMCKPWKFSGLGDAARQSSKTLKAIGKTRRISRKDLGDQEY